MKILQVGLGHSIHLKKWTEQIEFGMNESTQQVIFSCRPPEWKLTDDKYPYYFHEFNAYLSPKRVFDLNELDKIAREIIKKEDPDLCIAYSIVDSAPAIIALRQYSPMPIITILWNAMDLPEGKHYDKCFPYTSKALAVSNKIMGAELLNKISSAYYSIPESKYMINRPMVDTKIFYNKKMVTERKGVSFIRGPGELYFPHECIKAVPLVLEKFPQTEFKFFITHDNPINRPKQEKCKKLAEELGVRYKIDFIDRQLPFKEYAEALNDTLVAVSLKSDDPDIPFSFINAALCGAIVIASDTQWIRSIITHDEHALLVKHNAQDIAHSIIEALRHPELANIFYKNNLELFRECTLEKGLFPYLEMLRQCVNDQQLISANHVLMDQAKTYFQELAAIGKIKNIKVRSFNIAKKFSFPDSEPELNTI